MHYEGVNLGGWLVLERWITPSLFSGMQAQDEQAFIREAGATSREVIDRHRRTFIASADLEWLKSHGVSAVRLPVPHWIFGGFNSYEPGIEYVDWLMDEARRLDIKVVLDLHTAPGSQNGHDHSGQKGSVGWYKSSLLIDTTLQVLELLAFRYCESKQLIGIELLNEPSGRIPRNVLESYYQRGYQRVRKYCGEDIAVIISDQFKPLEWRDFMAGPDHVNVWLDAHLYQAFDTPASEDAVLKKVNRDWQQLIDTIQAHRPLIIGEWSIGLGGHMFDTTNQSEKARFLGDFWQQQKAAFAHATANFFWTYKTETMTGWSFRTLIEEKIITSTGTIR